MMDVEDATFVDYGQKAYILRTKESPATQEKRNSIGNRPKLEEQTEIKNKSSNMVNFDNSYAQILNLRQDFLKSANDVSAKYHVRGCQFNPRRALLLFALSLIFSVSSVATTILWFTSCFQNAINSLMVISEDSLAYNIWKSPPPRLVFKFYLFNYTNVADYEAGTAKKLNVQEIGPYAYYEQMEKVNIRFNRDGTVSYQEKRIYTFSEELSKGRPDDIVTVPNIALLSGAAVVKDYNVIFRISYNTLLNKLEEKPFFTIEANKFIEGYENRFTDLSKQYLKFQNQKFFEKMGLLAMKQGIQPDVITVNTGVKIFENMGRIERFNDKTELDLWKTFYDNKCNNVRVSDGTIYPKTALKNRQTVRFFVPQMCRSLPLVFDKEISVLDGVNALRYRLPLNLYDTPDKNFENGCYCTLKNYKEVCSPQGVFDASECISGAPMFFSFPYFYNADPIFQESLTGLKAPVKPNIYMDLHPSGLAMGGRLQSQVNIQVQKSYGIYTLDSYKDGLMLPVFWVDGGLDEENLGSEIVGKIYALTFTAPNVELAMKYTSLLTMIVSLAGLIFVLKRSEKGGGRRMRTDSTRPLRRD